MTKYVAGFMFNAAKTEVALIRKIKPAWQAGKLNGIGGKIEGDEPPADAMVREFAEETNHLTRAEQWSHFLQMTGSSNDGWSVDFFATIGDLQKIESPEAEKTEIISVADISPLRDDVIENLPWLIPLALDHLHDGRPEFSRISYP